jgi:hypothetical protein
MCVLCKSSDVSEVVQKEGKTIRAYNYISGFTVIRIVAALWADSEGTEIKLFKTIIDSGPHSPTQPNETSACGAGSARPSQVHCRRNVY